MLKVILLICCFAAVEVFSNPCDKSILPDLTFRLSGNELEWPCQSTKNIYTTTGRYIPKNVITTRTQIHRDEAIVAMPRYKSGVPFTLGKLSLKKGACVSTIAPFPCWSMQEEGNCEALQSAVDLYLDAHDILWVLDVGIVNTLEQPIRRCPPKIVGIHVRTGKVVKVIDLSSITCSQSKLQHLVVDYSSDGKAYIYIADAGARAILVFDVSNNKGHRIVLPGAVSAGCSRNDVLYIVLVRKSCGATVLYFTYLGSSRLYSIKSEHLRQGRGSGAVVDVGPKPQGRQLVLLGTDNGCAIFMRYKGESDIYMWNTETCFKSSNFLEVQLGGECRLATQVVPGYRRYMWALESNFHDFIGCTVGCNGASVTLHPVVKECED